MKALKFTTVGMLLSGFALGQVTDVAYSANTSKKIIKNEFTTASTNTRSVEDTPGEEPVFKSGEFGVRYMPSYSALKLRTVNGTTTRGDFVVGHGFGILLALNSRHVGVQLEGIYNAIAQKYRDNNMDRTVHMNYINIPLLLTLNTDKSKPVNFSVAVGPQLGINVGSDVESDNNGNGNNNGVDTVRAVLALKQADFGVAYGAGLEFALNPARSIRLNLGFRGVLGLIDISDNSGTKATNEYFILDRTRTQVYAGYIGFSFLF